MAKIGTLRVNSQKGIQDIRIYSTDDPDLAFRGLRIQTPNGIGAINCVQDGSHDTGFAIQTPGGVRRIKTYLKLVNQDFVRNAGMTVTDFSGFVGFYNQGGVYNQTRVCYTVSMSRCIQLFGWTFNLDGGPANTPYGLFIRQPSGAWVYANAQNTINSAPSGQTSFFNVGDFGSFPEQTVTGFAVMARYASMGSVSMGASSGATSYNYYNTEQVKV